MIYKISSNPELPPEFSNFYQSFRDNHSDFTQRATYRKVRFCYKNKYLICSLQNVPYFDSYPFRVVVTWYHSIIAQNSMETILYIEDNDPLREEILDFLGNEGYEAIGAENGKRGIEIAMSRNIDLIMCDIMMKDIDGYEVKERIQANPLDFKVPFIFMSALSENDNIRKGMDLGADDYLIKPVSQSILKKSISARLEKARQHKNYVRTQLNELRENIIFSLTHELYTPLHVILGFSGLIKERTDSFNMLELREMAAAIECNGNRLHNLANNYLSNIVESTNKQSAGNLICDAFEVISPISEMVAERHHREADLILDVKNAHLQIDPDDLEFVVKEIVDNAFKFSESKSMITICGRSTGKYYKVDITDQGMGFPVEENSPLDIGAFNQFNRKKLEQHGTGFGLMTSLLIIQRNKGNLEIKNNETGASVSFTIPLFSNVSGSSVSNA